MRGPPSQGALGAMNEGRRTPGDLIPLNPVHFHILLVLLEGERHGYSIVKRVEERSHGTIRIEPANLYRSLRRLREQGVIEESERRPDPEMDDSRRRYFQLTPFGQRVLQAEADRLAHQLDAARSAGLCPEPGGAGDAP